MARSVVLLSCVFLLCAVGLSAAKENAVHSRAAQLNVHKVAHEDYLEEFGGDEEEEADEDLDGNIDHEIERLSDALQNAGFNVDADVDSLEDQDQEMAYDHKDADDDAYLDAIQGNSDYEDDRDEMASLLQSEDDDSEEEEEEDNDLDQYAIRNSDSMDFMSQADQEYDNVAREPIVAEELTRNEAFMEQYSPKEEKK